MAAALEHPLAQTYYLNSVWTVNTQLSRQMKTLQSELSLYAFRSAMGFPSAMGFRSAMGFTVSKSLPGM